MTTDAYRAYRTSRDDHHYEVFRIGTDWYWWWLDATGHPEGDTGIGPYPTPAAAKAAVEEEIDDIEALRCCATCDGRAAVVE